jgi:hypothetical protein
VPEEDCGVASISNIVLMCVFQEKLSQMVAPRYLAYLVIPIDVIYPTHSYMDHLTYFVVVVHLSCVLLSRSFRTESASSGETTVL